MQTGNLIIVSAPSGAGKTSLVAALLKSDPQVRLSVSFTTRAPRAGEVNGREYNFVDVAAFERMRANGEFGANARVHGRVSNHSAARDILRASFELGLQQHDSRCPLGQPERDGRQHFGERDERKVGHEEIDRRERRKVACVRPFEKGDARVFAQALVKLGPSDIDREHTGRAMLEEAIGEAARGGAEIEAAESGYVNGEVSESGFKFEPSAADIAFKGGQFDRRLGIEHLGGLNKDECAHPRPPRHDQALRRLARFGEPPFDEEDIGTEPWHGRIIAQRGEVVRENEDRAVVLSVELRRDAYDD